MFRRPMFAALAVLLGLPSFSFVTHAEGLKPRVWIGPIQARDGVAGASLLAEKFDEVSRSQLRRSKKVETSDQGGMGPVAAGDTDPRIEKAERFSVAAKAAYAAGKKDVAFKQLKAALELYEAGLASVKKIDPLLATLGYLGAAAFDLGYEGDARDYYRRVIAMLPDAEPLDEYSEGAKEYFKKVQKKLLRKKRGSIYVTSKPRGAVVKLNGVVKGKTPLSIKKLVRGEHYVQAEHPKAGLAGAIVKVKSRRKSRVKLALSNDVGPKAPEKASPEDVDVLIGSVASNQLDRKFKAKAQQVGEVTQSSYVVVGVIDAEGNGFVLNAFVYGVKEKQVVALDRFKFKADIASTMIQAARFAKEVEKSAVAFPQDKVLSGGVFVVRAEPIPAPPVPASKPAPAPAVVVAPKPKPVAKPTPKPQPEPVAVKPAEPKPAPVVTPLPQPQPGPDLARPEPVAPTPTSYTSRPKWYKSWWFWSVTGAVVVAGGVGGYLLLAEDEPSDQFQLNVRW